MMSEITEIKTYNYAECIGMTFVHKGKTFEFKVQNLGDCKENEFDVFLVRCEKNEEGQLTWEYGAWLIDTRIDFHNEENDDE